MADGGDPRGAVDVEAYVPLLGDQRLAGVHAHADADRPVTERALCVVRGRKRIGRSGEGDEERVALRVHLDAAVARKRLAEHAPVLGQHVRVPVPQFLQ